MGFDYLYCSSVDGYIAKFKELYAEDIIFPCGVHFYCGLKDEEIMHMLCGKGKTKLNKGRAGRISWIKEIIEDETSEAKISCKKILLINKYKQANCVVVCIYNPTIKKVKVVTFYVCDIKQYLFFKGLPSCDLTQFL